MRIDFACNDRPTVGIELELSLVDRETGALTSAASAILAELGQGRPGGTHPRAKHELFECTIEIITDVCRSIPEARADLERTLGEVRDAADRRGLEPISVGTHPFSSWRDQEVSPDPRYHELVEELQWTARRLAIYGVHFHVAVGSGEQSIAVANALRSHLPLFLALSASSPYWEQEDSGLASSRIKIFESLPTAGLNPRIRDWAEFEGLMATLIEARSIRSIREVWWDIRPHPDYGTVELRMCDAPPTLREVAALGALAQTLVVSLSRQFDDGSLADPAPEWTVRENKWLATRHGTDAQLIVDAEGGRRHLKDLVHELVDGLAPLAAELDCAAELDDLCRIFEHGASYQRQRALVRAGASPGELVKVLSRELATDRPTSA